MSIPQCVTKHCRWREAGRRGSVPPANNREAAPVPVLPCLSILPFIMKQGTPRDLLTHARQRTLTPTPPPPRICPAHRHAREEWRAHSSHARTFHPRTYFCSTHTGTLFSPLSSLLAYTFDANSIIHVFSVCVFLLLQIDWLYS